MATTGQAADSEIDVRPFRMNVDRYEKLVESGIFNKYDKIFLWHGRIVEKIREGFDPTPEGEFPEHRMTIDRYLRMVEAGIFTEEDRVFLWKGSLLEKMTKGHRHSHSALKLDHLLNRLLPAKFHAELEQPMMLGNDTLPEPDVMVLRGSLDDFDGRMPTARDVAWIVEVADSSVAFDSIDKLKAYAAESIPIYWIANIPARRISVYAKPTGPAEQPSYRENREYGPDDEIPMIVDGIELGRVFAREILPRSGEDLFGR